MAQSAAGFKAALPAGQIAHAADPCEIAVLPSAQAVHSVSKVEPLDATDLPGEQAVQNTAPVPGP